MALILLFPTILAALVMLALLVMGMNACCLVLREKLSGMASRRSDRHTPGSRDAH